MELVALGLGDGSISQWGSPTPGRAGASDGGGEQWPIQKRKWVDETKGPASAGGIWSAPEGLLFGVVFVAYPDHAQLACPAQMAPSKKLEQRHKWCTKSCTAEDAHQRPPGIPEYVENMQIPEGAVWTTIREPDAAEERSSKGGRGHGGKASGKGSSSSSRGKGGKGGGKPTGKGGGKAKGQDGGRKGGRGSFRRQWT